MCAQLSKISRRALGILDLCLSFLLLASRLGLFFPQVLEQLISSLVWSPSQSPSQASIFQILDMMNKHRADPGVQVRDMTFVHYS
jgi:hypothetical protein